MKWVPPWLARAYACLYAAKKDQVFGFSEAGRILEINDERRLAKTLGKLRISGHLTVRRDPTDPRRKLFRLVDPNSVVLAMAIQSKAKSADFADKLRIASGFLDYYVGGAYAAYQFHHYSAAGKIDISVRRDQLTEWIALLSENDVSISMYDYPAEKHARTNIHLHSDFEENFSELTKTIDGIRYLSPELLVVLAMLRESPNHEDALAILVVLRKKLDWKLLLKTAESYSAIRQLGCSLDILNFESKKRLFDLNLIKRIMKQSNLEARLDFPDSRRGEAAEERYQAISSKWNVRLHISHATVSKIVTDLVRR